jgi:imidazolonepropionase-like amidohydrolase
MTGILFRNFSLLDPRWDTARGGYEVLIEGDRIREVSDKPIKSANADVVDCGGRTLMPGLIDCHVHVYLVELGLHKLESMPLTLLTAKASVLLKAMIDRGFTTVRDTGGADWGIKEAVDTGVLAGPRLFISGRPISVTGGHGDSRRRTSGDGPCKCCNALSFVLETADGVDAMRKAVREQMRQGADQIKIFVSGGVASPWIRSTVCNLRRTRSPPPSKRRTRSDAMYWRMPTRRRRSRARSQTACARSSTAI